MGVKIIVIHPGAILIVLTIVIGISILSKLLLAWLLWIVWITGGVCGILSTRSKVVIIVVVLLVLIIIRGEGLTTIIPSAGCWWHWLWVDAGLSVGGDVSRERPCGDFVTSVSAVIGHHPLIG